MNDYSTWSIDRLNARKKLLTQMLFDGIDDDDGFVEKSLELVKIEIDRRAIDASDGVQA